jgi:hypothetical protein
MSIPWIYSTELSPVVPHHRDEVRQWQLDPPMDRVGLATLRTAQTGVATREVEF